MRKRHRKLVDAPRNKEEKDDFDKIYKDYKEMFRSDPIFINIIGRKLFGNDKKKRYRFREYAIDNTLVDLYNESKIEKSLEYVK